jgi:hypothetical protein
MDIAFSKLCKEIKFISNPFWERTFLLDAKLERTIFLLSFQCDDLIPLKEMKEFLSKLSKNFKYQSKPRFSIVRQSFDKKEIHNYII